MKKFRILAVVIFVCALADVGLRVLSNLVDNQPLAGGFTLGDVAIWVVVVCVAVFWWFLARAHEKRLKQYAETSARRATDDGESSGPPLHDYAGLLVAMERRLDPAGYSVARDVALPTGGVADLAASRVEFSLGQRPVVQHLFLRHLTVATLKDFDALFEAGYRYACSAYHGAMHVILPCIAIDTATPELIAVASGRPPKRWMRFEFPVAYDLATGRTYYHGAGTPLLGSMLFPGARALANLAFDIGHPSTAS